jgi:hypothetical protein
MAWLIALATMLFATGTGSASAEAPIAGVWSFSGGKVAIQAQPGGTFTGIVVAPTKFAECTHSVGEQMWTQITPQADGSYWGSHQWFFANAECVPNPALGPTAWRVLGNNSSQFLRVCFSEPGSNAQPTIAADGSSTKATFGCVDSARISALPKLSPKKLAGFVQLPRNRSCLGQKKLRITLHDPANDPFVKIEVSLKSGKLLRKGSVKRHQHGAVVTVSLKGLQASDFTIRVRLTTVLGRHLSLHRKYHLCAGRGSHGHGQGHGSGRTTVAG